jgi:hypothetical protein
VTFVVCVEANFVSHRQSSKTLDEEHSVAMIRYSVSELKFEGLFTGIVDTGSRLLILFLNMHCRFNTTGCSYLVAACSRSTSFEKTFYGRSDSVQLSKISLTFVFAGICRPYARHPLEVSDLPLVEETKKYYHVAQSRKTVYAIRHKSQALHIFEDRPNHRPQASVLRLGDLQATSLAASDTGDVYLTARSDNWIWRLVSAFQSVGSPAAAERWVTTKRASNANHPLSLSLSAGRLLVVKRDELMVYDPSGNRSCLVVVQGHVHMRHAVETSHATFVACVAERIGSGSGSSSSRSVGLVAEIDSGGRLLRSVNIDGGCQSPLYLDVDCDGRYFVVDSRGSSVLLLNDAFDVERVILNCDASEKGRLVQLSYVAHAGQLLVAMKGGHLRRYRIRQRQGAA